MSLDSDKLLRVALGSAVPEDAAKSVREQTFYLSPRIRDARVEGDAVVIVLNSEEDDPDALADAVKGIVARTTRGFRHARAKVLFRHDGSGAGVPDPLQELMRRGDVRRHAPGVYTFQGDFLRLMFALDRTFRDFGLELGAVEQHYPPTVLTSSMVANGYLRSFPHHALLISGVERRQSAVETLSGVGSGGASITSALAEPRHMLAPAVCYRCFEALSGDQTQPAVGALYTGWAHCSRNEGFIDDDLTRLQSFSMREIIFIGTEAQVEAHRQKVVSHAREKIGDWGLTAQMATASDPFFAVDEKSKRSYQSLLNLKYEMQVLLPASDRWLACMSFNNHQATLTGAYRIGAPSGEELHSGCAAYGLERLAYAIFSQHGLDTQRWPAALRALYESAA